MARKITAGPEAHEVQGVGSRHTKSPLREAQSARLAQAREAAGYKNKKEGAIAAGVGESTYYNHEGGFGLGRHAELYAKVFRVSVGWLINGEASQLRKTVPMLGVITKGGVTQKMATALPKRVAFSEKAEAALSDRSQKIAALLFKTEDPLFPVANDTVLYFDKRLNLAGTPDFKPGPYIVSRKRGEYQFAAVGLALKEPGHYRVVVYGAQPETIKPVAIHRIEDMCPLANVTA